MKTNDSGNNREIRFEEYFFGHKGGMGPICWSSTLSETDLSSLYNLAVQYHGASSWNNDNWSVNSFQLPSKKYAVTAIFPDSDMAGRSTIFGHAVILEPKEYKKTGYYPFFLKSLGLFVNDKAVSIRGRPTKKQFSYNALLERYREVTAVAPEGYLDVLRLILVSKRKIMIETAVPANRLFEAVYACLPPVVRSGLSFSTMEVNPESSSVKLGGNARKHSRNLVLMAVPPGKLEKFSALKDYDVFSFKEGVLRAIKSDIDAKTLKQSPYANAVEAYMQSGEELLPELLDKIEAIHGPALDQKAYSILIQATSPGLHNVLFSNPLKTDELKDIIDTIKSNNLILADGVCLELLLHGLRSAKYLQAAVEILQLIQNELQNTDHIVYLEKALPVYMAVCKSFPDFFQALTDHLITDVSEEGINKHIELIRRIFQEILERKEPFAGDQGIQGYLCLTLKLGNKHELIDALKRLKDRGWGPKLETILLNTARTYRDRRSELEEVVLIIYGLELSLRVAKGLYPMSPVVVSDPGLISYLKIVEEYSQSVSQSSDFREFTQWLKGIYAAAPSKDPDLQRIFRRFHVCRPVSRIHPEKLQNKTIPFHYHPEQGALANTGKKWFPTVIGLSLFLLVLIFLSGTAVFFGVHPYKAVKNDDNDLNGLQPGHEAKIYDYNGPAARPWLDDSNAMRNPGDTDLKILKPKHPLEPERKDEAPLFHFHDDQRPVWGMDDDSEEAFVVDPGDRHSTPENVIAQVIADFTGETVLIPLGNIEPKDWYSRSLRAQDYVDLFNAGFNHGQSITFRLLTADGEIVKEIGTHLIYGEFVLDQKGEMKYRPWAVDDTILTWRYIAPNLPVDYWEIRILDNMERLLASAEIDPAKEAYFLLGKFLKSNQQRLKNWPISVAVVALRANTDVFSSDAVIVQKHTTTH